MKKIFFISLLVLSGLSAHARVVLYDANKDGAFDINDVTAVIQYVLSGDASMISLDNADVNVSGNVDIVDVTTMIDRLLHGGVVIYDDPEDIVTYTVNGVSFSMVPVEGGTFMMGSTRNSWEQPVHEVTLSDYWIGQTEVTFGLWRAVMGTSHLNYSDEYAVCFVSWDMCQDFVAALNELTGMNFHLPTEAQWEFAARGGNLSHGYLYAGSDNLEEVAWINLDEICKPVGLLKPNELGLYDMSGNVAEYCWDTYGGWIRVYSYDSEPQTDPLYTYDKPWARAVIRGGSCATGNFYDDCTVTNRDGEEQRGTVALAGLRLALGPD